MEEWLIGEEKANLALELGFGAPPTSDNKLEEIDKHGDVHHHERDSDPCDPMDDL